MDLMDLNTMVFNDGRPGVRNSLQNSLFDLNMVFPCDPAAIILYHCKVALNMEIGISNKYVANINRNSNGNEIFSK